MIIVSKATKHHCAGTVQSQAGRVGNVKQVGFEPRPEDSYGRCGSDKIRQTVPDASSGDRISSVTDGRQSGAGPNFVGKMAALKLNSNFKKWLFQIGYLVILCVLTSKHRIWWHGRCDRSGVLWEIC